MEYQWDDEKETYNRAKHKISFEAVEDFQWERAVIVNRSRHTDGEERYAAIAPFGRRIHRVIFTWRQGRMRIISFGRANKAEEKIYEQEKI